jgi:Sporulation control protein
MTTFFYKLNMAYCHFAEGDFDAALDWVPEVPSSSHYHHMVRRLEIKIYYEQDSDLLLYKLDAFRKFLERTASKVISAPLREMDLNFTHIVSQLAQSPPKDKARSARLQARISAKKLLADRAWLMEKARQLG